MPQFQNSGDFLRKYRKEQNITQRDLAKSLGNMNSQFVSNWERGLCMPPTHAMRKLLKRMNPFQKQALKECFSQDVTSHYWNKYR